MKYGTALLCGLSIAASVVVLFLWATPACAEQGDLSLELSFASYHLPRDKAKKMGLNEMNLGGGLMYGLTDWMDLKAGAYQNSYDKLSAYAGANFKRTFTLWKDPVYDDHSWFVAPGLMLGAATGYEDTPPDTVGNNVHLGLLPLIIPNVQFGHRNLFATVGVIPPLADNQFLTFTFQLGVRLWP